MARSRSTLGKLQRDQAKRARSQAKQEDRLARRENRAESAGDPQAETPVERQAADQARVLEQFARLHKDKADGLISDEAFEVRQEELRALLMVD